MKILVTGGAGFIGSHLVEHFHDQAAEIRVLDDLRTGHEHNLAGLKCRFVNGSILDRALLAELMVGVDYVFHFAALVSVPESMAEPVACNRINAGGLLNVLECAAAAGVRKLCFSSTSAIYGENPVSPKREDLPPDPHSPYAVTKLDGEYYCRIFTDTGRLRTACLRYFNVFGPRQDPHSAYAAAIPIFIHKALRNEDLTIYGDGEQTRDFVYVKDVAAANAHFALSEHTGVYNVAYGQAITINDLAAKIIALTGSTSRIVYAAERPGDVKHSRAAVERLTATGYQPVAAFAPGLETTVAHFRRLHQPATRG